MGKAEYFGTGWRKHRSRAERPVCGGAAFIIRPNTLVTVFAEGAGDVPDLEFVDSAGVVAREDIMVIIVVKLIIREGKIKAFILCFFCPLAYRVRIQAKIVILASNRINIYYSTDSKITKNKATN